MVRVPDFAARIADEPGAGLRLRSRWGALSVDEARIADPWALHENDRAPWHELATRGDEALLVDWAKVAAIRGSFWTDRVIERAVAANPSTAALNPSVPWTAELLRATSPTLPIPLLAANPRVPWDESLFVEYEARLLADNDDWHPDDAWSAPRWLNEHVRVGPTGIDHLQQNPGVRWAEVLARLPVHDWAHLSRNVGLPWSETFVEAHLAVLDLALVASNPGVPWSMSMVHRWSDRLDFDRLSGNVGAIWTDELWEATAARLVPSVLATNPAVSWTEERLASLGDDPAIVRALARNPGASWTLERFDRLRPRLDVVVDKGWPTSALIAAYTAAIDWQMLSANVRLTWTLELLDEFRDRWSWELLSANPSLPWSVELLDRHAARWHLGGLLRNPVAGRIAADLV